jgi:hypothetical protein
MLPNKYFFPLFIFAGTFLISCSYFGDSCSCDEVQRFNVCVLGKYTYVNDSIYIVREKRSEMRDTLSVESSESSICFSEWSGEQRIIVSIGNDKFDSSSWFKQIKVDCCRYKDSTITF